MAPEMLGGGRLEERTDVYLLGAILHEILVGRPPHVGDSFRAIVASILRSPPSFPDEVPPELATIASRALGRKPEDRFASAEEVRDRVEWYLRHRGSLALSTEAARSVDALRAVLGAADGSERLRERVHHLFAEARFGFRQALNASGDNEVARIGLREVSELVAGFELDQGTPEAAAAALAEIDSPSPELAARVAEAMGRREEEKARVTRLEKLSAEHDPAIGRRTRLALGSLLGLFWAAAPLGYGVLYRHSFPPPRWSLYAVTAVAAPVALAFVWWGRESLAKTALNRRTSASLLMLFAMQFALQLGCNLLGLPVLDISVLHLFVWLVMAGTFAIHVDRMLWPSVLGYLVAFLGACCSREWVWALMAASNVVLTINVLVGWARPGEDSEFFVERMYARIERTDQRRR
jgi:serine/threonine-protein kinase